eukprot:TRINITY_DN4298_c0_g1_i1.p1 TRINITY_DN4298_c0_g1~~TRINITY_DN4298_c0_g1_i1.p1  ORF type:complete len:804 (+),score=227.59 TRINITY_DN4298_c0_g1_i1:309-2414(+)
MIEEYKQYYSMREYLRMLNLSDHHHHLHHLPLQQRRDRERERTRGREKEKEREQYEAAMKHSSSLSYLNGLNSLRMSDFEVAHDSFLRAASGLDIGNDFLFRLCCQNDREEGPELATESSELTSEGQAEADINERVRWKEWEAKQRYFIHIMRLYESELNWEMAIRFARYGLSDCGDERYRSKSRFRSVLWSCIFKHSLTLLRFEDAYVAMVSNPDVDRQRDCLKTLVVGLCKHGKVKMLCELPFVGWLDDVDRTLMDKARTSDICERPDYYHVLYSFHILRGNYRQAGQVMYELSQRIAMETHPKTVATWQMQAKSLLLAVNAMRLVHPKFAWVVRKARQLRIGDLIYDPSSLSWARSDHKEREKDKKTTDDIALPSADDKALPSSPKRRREEENMMEEEKGELFQAPSLTSTKPNTTSSSIAADREELMIINLSEMEKQYALTLAQLEIALSNENHPVGLHGITPEDSLSLLVRSGYYDKAIDLASVFHLDMRQIFERLTDKYLALQEREEGSRMAAEKELERGRIESGYELLAEDFADLSDASWQILRDYLQKFDSAKTNYVYHQVVAEKILSSDPPIRRLPTWLMTSFLSKHPSLLLRILLKFDLLEECASAVLKLISSTEDEISKSEEEADGKRNNWVCWLPYTAIDQLMIEVERRKDDPNLNSVTRATMKELFADLQVALDTYLTRVKAASHQRS